MFSFLRLSQFSWSASVMLACVLFGTVANAVIIDGGQLVNISTQITGNNEDVILYSGTINLNPGGVIGNALYVMYPDSVANFVGGRIENFAYLNNGVLNISSGEILRDVTAGITTWANGQPMGLGQVNIYGGNFTNPNGYRYLLHAVGNGRVDIYGGDISNRKLFTQQSGAIYIHGTDFNYGLGVIPVSEGTLTGILASGESFSVPFESIGLGAVHLVAPVPEPSTLVLGACGLAFAGWHAWRRKRGYPASIAATSLAFVVAFLCTDSTQAVTMEMVTVGNPGNAADAWGYGAVPYEYRIGKYEVTIQQYADFLNSVAKSDPYSLYDVNMGTVRNIAGISRSGPAGSYSYSVINNGGYSGNRPITFVSWFDAARFANWMHNGQGTGSTETGAYTLGVGHPSIAPAKNPGATFYIPTEDEWYKAAFYSPDLNSGAGGYYLNATQSDADPGNMVGGAANQANYAPGRVYSVTQSGDYDPTQNYLTDVGAFAGSASYYGTFDQSGNVHEWNDLAGAPLTYRGGLGQNWAQPSVSSISRTDMATVSSDGGLGFRLASPIAVPEPSTVVMAACGLAITAWRAIRRRQAA